MKLTPNFTREEFDCHDGTIVPSEYLPNVIEVAKNLEVLRAFLKKNIRIVSGYRTKEHNAKIKGSSPVSQHLQGKASDIVVPGISPEKVYEAIEYLISQGKMKQTSFLTGMTLFALVGVFLYKMEKNGKKRS